MVKPTLLRSLVVLFCLTLLLTACGDTGDTGSETTASSTTMEETTTTAATTTTAPVTTTTTTTQPTTTTTTAPTTTTAACPDFPSIGMTTTGLGEDVEPGTYQVAWAFPSFTFTVAEPTTVWLGDRFDIFGWRPNPIPQWQHPRMNYEALEFMDFDFLLSYDGESEIEIPDDPGEWLTQHPLWDASDSIAITIDGYEGVQVDAVVVGSHPGTGDSVRFGGYNDRPGQKWIPQGAAVRIIFVEVEDESLWLMLTAVEDGFDDAAVWADTVIAGIDFC
jgi:hypothetical protein